MNPFFKRYGGKFYLKNKIIPYFPSKISEYVEPFLGGGSIFLNLGNYGIEVKQGCFLNDIDKDIFSVWKCFYDPSLFHNLMDLFEKYAMYSEDVFNYIKEMTPKNDVEQGFKVMMLSMQSFQGRGKSYYIGIGDIGRTNSKIYKPIEYWKKYMQYIKKMNVKISNKDYSVFFQGSFNRASTFIYADPPYFGTIGYDNCPFSEEDHEHLCELVKGFKGRIVLSLNDHEWVRDAYKDFTQIPIITRWAGNAHSDKNNGITELLILNYSVKKESLILKNLF